MIEKQIKCPHCGHLTFYSLSNPFRPFCSERCRLIDLGQWADGKYSIPTEEHNPDIEEPHDKSCVSDSEE